MLASQPLKTASSLSVRGSSARSALRPMCALRPVFGRSSVGQPRRAGFITVPRSTEPETPAEAAVEETILESESISAQKKANAERLRAAEKFMVVGAGNATCKGCGYEYKPEAGDPDFPVPKGTKFESLPDDYTCPICGANKDKFQSRVKVVAGFAENQRYGLGTNSMTGDQKLGLIYGALGFFFLCFLAGYALQ